MEKNTISMNEEQERSASSTKSTWRRPTPKKALIAAIVFVILLFAVALVARVIDDEDGNTGKTNSVSEQPLVAKVEVGKDGFSPSTISIKKGTVVEWEATDKGIVHIIASNPYPKNDDLSGLKSSQFGQGATYRYQFDKEGTFEYHDDLNPTKNGTVVVK